MLHYTCDRCKSSISSGQLRYEVRIEAQAAVDLDDCGCDSEDRDHLAELEELMESSGMEDDDLIGDDIYVKRRYDLCRACFQKFVQDPLSGKSRVELSFGDN